MKILTIRQPHVAAIFAGLKPWETRSKPTSYRGRLGIHSALRPDDDRLGRLLGTGRTMDWAEELRVRFDLPKTALGRGVIVGIAELVACIRTEDVPRIERDWGDFSAGRWAWRLENPRLLPTPIPAKGALSFWTFDVPGTFR